MFPPGSLDRNLPASPPPPIIHPSTDSPPSRRSDNATTFCEALPVLLLLLSSPECPHLRRPPNFGSSRSLSSRDTKSSRGESPPNADLAPPPLRSPVCSLATDDL
ncbi:hypothetical protein EYF80_052581 [Liparis tanakae]|uniref:Uncharacterized protein n=1 Tax=Liparis tanakae TaxID=230148 RepID=A0A4Z2F8P8_9TELE|nr:hypothetical protein EYF80_052581 [Liparis tanakae]